MDYIHRQGNGIDYVRDYTLLHAANVLLDSANVLLDSANVLLPSANVLLLPCECSTSFCKCSTWLCKSIKVANFMIFCIKTVHFALYDANLSNHTVFLYK